MVFSFRNKQQQENNEQSPRNSYHQQDEEEPYSADIYQADLEYDALPIESSAEEPASNILLNFEGEGCDNVVLVPGLLGFNKIGGQNFTLVDYWRDVREIVECPIVVDPSPLGSLHDRAVEIFYQLKGGRVDYGAAHSSQFSHKQHGKTHEGQLPDWSEDNPIVLIGKGYGATTALHLQHLLATDFFGQNTSGKWIKAIICWSAPHRGSTFPYILGLQPGTKTVVHPFSLMQLFLALVHIICYFTWLDVLFGFQLSDKWSLSSKEDGGEQSFWSALSGRSGFSYFGDNFMVDWSVEGARSRYANGEVERHQLDPSCVYINYVRTGQTWRSRITGHYWPRITWSNWPTALISVILGRYKLSPETEQQVLRTPSSNFWENDGTLSVYSQLPPPHQQIAMNIALPEKLFDPVDHELTPGAWYNVYVQDRSHTVLFESEHYLLTFPIIVRILQLAFIRRIAGFLSRNAENMEISYINGVEFIERNFSNIKGVMSLNKDVLSEKMTGLKFAGQYSAAPISDRFEQRASDKAGGEWMRRIEQIEVFNSPSRMIFWMKQMEKSRMATTTALETGTATATASPEMVKDELINVTNPLTATATFSNGPMFVKARQKMTAEEYKASFNASSNGSEPF